MGSIASAGTGTRLTIVQYAGDFRAAFERFAAGGKATYQAQRYSVATVGALAARLGEVAVVCLHGTGAHDVRLANGVRAIGIGLPPGRPAADAIPAIASTRPTHLLLTTPSLPLLRWARRTDLRTMAVLADSFRAEGLRDRLRNWRLARALGARHVDWVGNHGLNACLSLAAIGVPPARIVPWDWPPAFDPHDQPPRERGGGPLSLVYVGAIGEAKGVGDLIDAVALLRKRDVDVTLTVYGHDNAGAMAARAARLGLGPHVRMAGMIANEDVPGAMRIADIVVIPSRADYPEGLPLTIYEALSSRTPIVASDHPMFRGAIRDGESASIFRGGDPADLADTVARLADDAALYARLSVNAAAAWDALQLPVRWGELIDRWLADDDRWIAGHAMSAALYQPRLAERRAAMAG